MKKMFQAFAISGALAAPLNAQTLPKYEIIPFGGTYAQNTDVPWRFYAIKIDRVKSRTSLCSAFIISGNGENNLKSGGCRAVTAPQNALVGNPPLNSFKADPRYNGLNNIPPSVLWAIHVETGGVTVCLPVMLGNQNPCVSTPDLPNPPG